MQFTTDIISLLASNLSMEHTTDLKKLIIYIYLFIIYIYTCQLTAPLHFIGLVMAFKRLSGAQALRWGIYGHKVKMYKIFKNLLLYSHIYL